MNKSRGVLGGRLCEGGLVYCAASHKLTQQFINLFEEMEGVEVGLEERTQETEAQEMI